MTLSARRAVPVLVAVIVLAGCGSTTVLHSPPRLGPARGEARDPQPVARHFNPKPGSHPEKATFYGASGCGVERWAVKTGTDPGANAVNTVPQNTSIADLTVITPPANPTDRVAPTETTTFRLQATILAIKQEADSDYHLEITDGVGHTMIAESPSVSCDSGSVFASQIASVRATINQACPNIGGSYQHVSIPADLTGVGFFDRIHGQLGVAPNGIELHPLLAIVLNGRC